MMDAALTVLVDRAGGSVTYTEVDFQAVLARHGGPAQVNIRIDVIRGPGVPNAVRLTLEEKAPQNAELVT